MRLKTLLILPALIAAVSCSTSRQDERERLAVNWKSTPVLPETEMVQVDNSFLIFNAALHTGRLIDGAEHMFPLLQQAFWISSTPVTPKTYEAYMGPGTWPEKGISHDDAQAFLDRVYGKTGIPVVLPTEAMYEAALEAGVINPEKSYSELLADGWASTAPEAGVVRNWKVKDNGDARFVVRKPYARECIEPYRRRQTNSFRIAVRTNKEIEQSVVDQLTPSRSTIPEFSNGQKEVFEINGVSFSMLPVEGGALTLGATPEQEKYAEEDEAPIRDVSLPSFKLSETEVTVALWEAVMGGVPAMNEKGFPGRAVVGISWYDAQRFLLRLQQLTGRPFRLPSEDEWEYAARGGKKTHGYVFAGGNSSKDYVVCTEKDVRPRAVDVASKKPNELGLYDMSGNAWEWVRGTSGDDCILRGGSRLSKNTACRVSNRQMVIPEARKDSFGFRIAL